MQRGDIQLKKIPKTVKATLQIKTTFIYMANFTFHWVKFQHANHYITFSSLLRNFKYAASILKLHCQGKNTFYISSVVNYHFCVFLHLIKLIN